MRDTKSCEEVWRRRKEWKGEYGWAKIDPIIHSPLDDFQKIKEREKEKKEKDKEVIMCPVWLLPSSLIGASLIL